MSKKVEVFVRIRSSSTGVWETEDGKVYLLDPQNRSRTSFDGFSGVFHREDNPQIYSTCIQGLVEKFLLNENSTVFAYGQTGSGKTYTILGESGRGIISLCVQGIISLCVQDILRRGTKDITVSYLEIYNEKVFDLSTRSELQIYTIDNTPVLSNLSSTPISTSQALVDFLERCESNRKYGSTEFNTRSSRSHTIFQVRRGESNTLNLIDLAGSEKASIHENRRKEGSFINKSLLALCNLVTNIQRGTYLGYRDSKLTRLLQASLDGTTNIVALCMISPQKNCVEESIATLKFAGRLSNLEIKIRQVQEEDFKIRIHKTDMKLGYYREQYRKDTMGIIQEGKVKRSQEGSQEGIQEGIDFYQKVEGIDFYQTEEVYPSREKMVLLERITSLEKMVVDMLKKYPSKRMKEIFILEKHMFNLKMKEFEK